MSALKVHLMAPRAIALVSAVTLAAAASLVLFLFDPAQYGFYPRCFFHLTTGLLCPGCGSLRALHQLLHGHVAAAIHLNVLLVLGAPVAVWLAARSAFRNLNGQRQSLDCNPAWLWATLVMVVLFGILRNLPFAHAAWLAP